MSQELHRPTSRVLDILELLSRNPSGFTMSEISRRLNAPKSSLSPVLHTMQQRLFITSDPGTGKYRTGVNAYFSGCSYASPNPALDYIKFRMKSITERCRETCHLGIRSGGQVLYIAKEDSPNPVTLRSHVGQSLPAYCTGLGKALLIGCKEEELRSIYPESLQAYTSTTITDISLLYAELQKAKAEGFSYEHAELTEGIECIAVPLWSGGSPQPVAALSISVPAYRLTQEFQQELKTLLNAERALIEPYLDSAHITSGTLLISR